MATLEETKLEKLLIFSDSAIFHVFPENTLNQLSQFMLEKVAVGRTVTLWQLVLDLGVQRFVFWLDERFVHFEIRTWTNCH